MFLQLKLAKRVFSHLQSSEEQHQNETQSGAGKEIIEEGNGSSVFNIHSMDIKRNKISSADYKTNYKLDELKSYLSNAFPFPLFLVGKSRPAHPVR